MTRSAFKFAQAFRLPRFARSLACTTALVAGTVTAGCSDAKVTGLEPEAVLAAEITPQRPVYHGGVPLQFTVENTGEKTLQMAMCASGLQILAVTRWVDVRTQGACFAIVQNISPGQTGTAFFSLDEKLPDGIYRGRFLIWQPGTTTPPPETEFSEPFTLKRQPELSIR